MGIGTTECVRVTDVPVRVSVGINGSVTVIDRLVAVRVSVCGLLPPDTEYETDLECGLDDVRVCVRVSGGSFVTDVLVTVTELKLIESVLLS